MKIQKMVRLALLLSLALILAYLETLLPLPWPIPGLKLGLPNMVILFVIMETGYREALYISFARVVLVSLLFGTLFSPAFIISLCGAIFSWITMSWGYSSRKFSISGVSILGAATHNTIQIAMAAIILHTSGVFYFLPFLLLGSIPLGMITGWIVLNLSKRIKNR